MNTVSSNSSSGPTKASRNKKTPRILCVEDNDAVRDVVCHVLSFAGFQCESAPNGKDALERYAQGPDDFDVVVTDHWMAPVNGLELVTSLRLRGFNRGIIVHTAHLNALERIAYEGLGVDAILIKPLESVKLVETVSELTRNRRMRRMAAAVHWKTKTTPLLAEKGGVGCRSSFK